MDFFGIRRGSIREKAFSKLAKTTAQSFDSNSGELYPPFENNFARLLDETFDHDESSNNYFQQPLSRIAITLREYEVLMALCDSTKDELQSLKHGKLLLRKFSAYLMELPNQKFAYSVFKRFATNKSIQSQKAKSSGTLEAQGLLLCESFHSPWLELSAMLTSAILNLANAQPLQQHAIATLSDFINLIFNGDSKLHMSHYLAILGFIKALIKNPKLLASSYDAFNMFVLLDSKIDNPKFLTNIEIYSNANYSALNDYHFAMEFSPILYIESISNLMCEILNSILGNSKGSVMERLLKVAADSDKMDDDESTTDDKRDKNVEFRNPITKLENINENSNGSINGEAFEKKIYTTFKEGALEISSDHMRIIKVLSDIAIQKMEFLDRGETYIVYSTFSRLRIGYLAKSYNLQVIGAGMFTDNIPVKIAKRIFKNCLGISDVMLDPHLGPSVIQLGSLTTFKDEHVGSTLTRAFCSLVSNPGFAYCRQAAQSVALTSKVLSQDATVTTIYTLTNLLGGDLGCTFRKSPGSHLGIENLSRLPSTSSLNSPNHTGTMREYEEADQAKVFENAVVAVSEITNACKDETVATLTATILSQKVTKADPEFTAILLDGLITCTSSLPEREFVIILRLLDRLISDAKGDLFDVFLQAKIKLSSRMRKSPLFDIYLKDMLESICSIGEVVELEHHRPHVEISEIGEKIATFLLPLAEALPDPQKGEDPLVLNEEIAKLMRNFWFNMVVHGYSNDSKLAAQYATQLERIVYSTPPLASETLWDRTETSIELNTVLRRGSSNYNVKTQRHIIGEILDLPRGISYPKLMFLSATVFVESLRVKSGDCSSILNYFSDPSARTTGIDKYISPIAFKIVKDYVYLVNCGANKAFSNNMVARQLRNMLVLCCHRVESLQDAALQCCDLLINKVPSALCCSYSLFALFDILDLLFNSVADADKNRYQPKVDYTSLFTGVKLSLSDSYKWRRDTFNRIQEKSKSWLKHVLAIANDDIRSLCQGYVSSMTPRLTARVQYGVSFALEMAGSIGPRDHELNNLSQIPLQHFNTASQFLSGAFSGISVSSNENSQDIMSRVRINGITNDNSLQDCAILAIRGIATAEMIRNLVEIPFLKFDEYSMNIACSMWYAVIRSHESLGIILIGEICQQWEKTITQKKGLFSQSDDILLPELTKMEYAPSDSSVAHKAEIVSAKIAPHLLLIRMMSSTFNANLNRSDHLLKMFTQFVEKGLTALSEGASVHPYARLARFELVKFAFTILQTHSHLGSRSVSHITNIILDASLAWFKKKAAFPFGGNILKIKADYQTLKEVAKLVTTISSSTYNDKKAVLLYFLDDEISKISVWLNPLSPIDTRGQYISDISGQTIKHAYSIDPALAISLSLRYKIKNLDELLQKLLTGNPLPAIKYFDAVQYLIGINARSAMPPYQLLFWEPLPPIDAITLFLPPFGANPYVLQYTMRSLESTDVNLAFFYVPQIVQSLRFDARGYVERYIIETAQVSQLFAHQIIWNMLANSYRDEEATQPDLLKPSLDKIQESMIKSFSAKDKKFFEREFEFFGEVTDISGKLKPYIKKSKAEKKVKIDEEMAKIKILPGVYLPSNPDGVVIDINRKSGKPLQSHAKAPFMATFKIRKEVPTLGMVDKWQSAIFKVGDDCRQDVLALQLIAVFRTIWSNAGLDLFVYPYRVTATAPGCGVIDVLPNSVSRDMLGREAVNGLYEYFISKFGPESSKEFQAARLNLVRSLAAYSIISYLLQFKDRHNGNIMYDEQGHILHIDFGFCFDIVPGGVKFEMAPFKLTHEMVMVIGGSSNTQAFEWFEELCVKGYLACRPYMETIVRCVNPMLESGLPCFKDTTIKKLRHRFTPGKSEKEASAHMRHLIKKSMEAYSTNIYDEFQRITNGIPY